MAYDKERYEALIKASPLFEIDKDMQSAAYRKETMKMVEYLYCYLLAINEKKYEPYGCEIVDVATRCINGYDKTGEFLNYFNRSWKNEYSHICGDEIVDSKYMGLRLSDQERREIKKYMRLINRCNPEMSEEEKICKVAELMEMSVDEAKRIAALSETKVVGEYTSSIEGEEVSAFDLIADDFFIDRYFENLAALCEMLDEIEDIFLGLQDRQKPIVADMLTIKIGSEIFEIEKLTKTYSFISEDIAGQIKQTGTTPSQRDIAEKYGKNEASISRTFKEFLKKIWQIHKHT